MLAEALPTSYAGKSLAERNTGRFYTPDLLAAVLAEQVVRAHAASPIGPSLSVCDPFCGNGQLIVPLLEKLAAEGFLGAASIQVTLQDIDGGAVSLARQRVMAWASRHEVTIRVKTFVGDTFQDATAVFHNIVVTNPPWEQLKPDTRETTHLSPEDRARYHTWLRERSAELDARFPTAKASVRWGAWGTSLTRCGWEAALRACKPGATLGIVLPASLLADQASLSMRRSAFERSSLLDLSVFPPEARLFEKVDQGVVSAAFRVEPNRGIDAQIQLHQSDRTPSNPYRLKLSHEKFQAGGCSIPVSFGAGAADTFDLFDNFQRFKDLEGDGVSQLWAGRELDETRVALKLEKSKARPFVKGRMIKRHGVAEPPTLSVQSQYAENCRSPAYERLVWRDVARSSQRRRMVSAVIPRGWVAGNSLHVAHFRDGNVERLRALHAVVSSLAFEFQVRSKSSTGHMSLGVVRGAGVPDMSPLAVRDLAKADSSASLSSESERSLEIAVARAYGLERDSFAALLAHFPKIDVQDTEFLLSRDAWAAL